MNEDSSKQTHSVLQTKLDMKYKGSKCKIMRKPNNAQLWKNSQCCQIEKAPGVVMDSSVEATVNCLKTNTEI